MGGHIFHNLLINDRGSQAVKHLHAAYTRSFDDTIGLPTFCDIVQLIKKARGDKSRFVDILCLIYICRNEYLKRCWDSTGWGILWGYVMLCSCIVLYCVVLYDITLLIPSHACVYDMSVCANIDAYKGVHMFYIKAYYVSLLSVWCLSGILCQIYAMPISHHGLVVN